MVMFDHELSRLECEYRRRDSGNIPADRYSPFNEAALLHSQSLERNLLALLKRHGFTDLREKKILDLGCGNGGNLLHLLGYGAQSTNLFGIDLLAPPIARIVAPRAYWLAFMLEYLKILNTHTIGIISLD